jgi:hypothetical protein
MAGHRRSLESGVCPDARPGMVAHGCSRINARFLWKMRVFHRNRSARLARVSSARRGQRFTRPARLFCALDSTAVEGCKHFAVGIKPQNEIPTCVGFPSAEHRHHKDNAGADHPAERRGRRLARGRLLVARLARALGKNRLALASHRRRLSPSVLRIPPEFWRHFGDGSRCIWADARRLA